MPRLPMLRTAIPALLLAVSFLGCRGDATDPRDHGRLTFAVAPLFESAAAGIVDIDRIQIVLVRYSDESIVLDTIIDIPDGTDEVQLDISVELESPDEFFFLTLTLIDPQGQVAFIGGPIDVFPVTGGQQPPTIEVPLQYVGVGANAVAVVVTPTDMVGQVGFVLLDFGQSVTLEAVAIDANQTPIPGTPIGFRSLDPALVSVPDEGVPTIVGGSTRGSAGVVAELLTGPTFTMPVVVGAVDPLGDTFETTASDGLVVPDIIQFGGLSDGTQFLFIGIEFEDVVSTIFDGGTNTVVGFIDIDVDQDPATGAQPLTDAFRQDGGSANLGIEYYVNLQTTDEFGQYPIEQVNPDQTTTIVGYVPPDLSDPFTLFLTIPLALLGNDDGNVNLATVLGTQPEPTDISPDGSGNFSVRAINSAAPISSPARTVTITPRPLVRPWDHVARRQQ